MTRPSNTPLKDWPPGWLKMEDMTDTLTYDEISRLANDAQTEVSVGREIIAERDATIAALTRKIEELEKGEKTIVWAVASSCAGVEPTPHFDNEADAIAHYRKVTSERSYIRPDVFRKASIAKITTTISEVIPPPPVPDEGL